MGVTLRNITASPVGNGRGGGHWEGRSGRHRDKGEVGGRREVGLAASPHPSFWSGFSCRPESRRMRQSSYLSRVPEAPAAR